MKLQIPVMMLTFVAATILIGLLNTVHLQHSNNLTVIFEQTTKLLCTAKFFPNCTKWTFTSSDGTRSALIYSIERGVDQNFTRIEVKTGDERGCRLVINKTQLEDAGLYECLFIQEIDKARGNPMKFAVDVTVLDRNLAFTVNFEDPVKEGQNVVITCCIKFKGAIAPLMQWRRNEYDGLIVNQNVGTPILTTVNKENVTSTLKLIANHTIHNSKYVCMTYLTETETKETKYFHKWTSPTLNITYGPQNIQISSNRSDVESNEFKICVGEMLKCSADANPSASYEWIDDIGQINVTGSNLEIHQYMENMILWCRVFNSVSNRTSEKLRVVSWCPGLLPVVGIALPILAVSVIVVVVIFIIAHQRHSKDPLDRLVDDIQPYGEAYVQRNQPAEIQPYGEVLSVHPVKNIDLYHLNQRKNEAHPLYASSDGWTIENDDIARAVQVAESLYSEVQKKAPEVPKRMFYVGADGTEYMELGGVQATEPQAVSMERPVQSTYAMIDHFQHPSNPGSDRLL